MTIALLLSLSLAGRQAEAKVREAIATFEKALVAKDESLDDHLDLQALLREMERRGSIPDVSFRVRGVRRLEENLTTLVASPGALNGGWDRMVPLHVRVAASGDEADALCRVSIGGRKETFRVWLARSFNGWKISDLENLDGSYRLSVIGLQYAPGVTVDEDRQALRDGVMALQRGAVALQKGKPEAVREALAMARRCDPPPYVVDWIELTDGLALRAMGDPLLALKAADRVLSRQKDLAVALRLKAACHAELREHAPAVAAAKEYLKLVGDDAEIWTLIGAASERLGKADEALDAYRKGAAADPEDGDSRRELGRVLVERGRAGEGAPWLSESVRLRGRFESAADLLDGAGAHAEALALAEEEAAKQPDAPTVLARLGRGLRAVGRLKEAEEALVRASKLHPDDAEITREFVLVLAQAGKEADARALMKKEADGYVRAFVHAAAGRPAQALEELAVVFRQEAAAGTALRRVETEPVFEKLRSDKIVTAAKAAREYGEARRNPHLPPEEMLRIARERAEAVPEDALAYYDQGRALRRMRRYAEAEPLLRNALEKDKRLSNELARTLAAQGKLEEALAVAGEDLDLRVVVTATAGKRDAAIKALQALLEKDPGRHPEIALDDEFAEFFRLPAVQDLLRKARAKIRK
jgi:tetratricopeptide (TPR) repeat protein